MFCRDKHGHLDGFLDTKGLSSEDTWIGTGQVLDGGGDLPFLRVATCCSPGHRFCPHRSLSTLSEGFVF